MQLPQELSPSQEEERIQTLRKYDILDTPPDGAFDRITRLAAELLDMPIAIVSLVDTDRIWFKSHHGLGIKEIGRDPGLCASAILSDDFYLVEDAKKDLRTLANPLVAGEFGLRFYAAVPLKMREGFSLGTFCVIDKKPRRMSARKKKILEDLAEMVITQMELRLETRTAVKHQYQILRTAAHDLRNPLSIMPLLADMIIQHKDNPEAIENMSTQIKEAGKRMNKILTDVLESAREETNQVQLKLEAVNLPALVKGVVQTNTAIARKKRQKIHFEQEETFCLVYGDERRLTEIFDNLLNNAIKYSPEGKEIFVRIWTENEKAFIEFDDEGAGLTKDDLNNLFRPFVSLSAQPTGGEMSTGLGLSIVKNLVEAHKGEIYAESEGTGEGSTFTVMLPLSSEVED